MQLCILNDASNVSVQFNIFQIISKIKGENKSVNTKLTVNFFVKQTPAKKYFYNNSSGGKNSARAFPMSQVDST